MNIAVAWSCSLWSPRSPRGDGTAGTNPLVWSFKIEKGFGLERVVLTTLGVPTSKKTTPVPDYVETDFAGHDPNQQFAATKLYHTTGWPWYSFRSETSVFEPARLDIPPITVPDYPKVSWQSGVILKVDQPRPPLILNRRPIIQIPHVLPSKILPLRPLPSGLLLNTIFYSAMIWLVAIVPFKLRRFVRHRSGRCINCGYDLRGTAHDICPECASAIGKV